MVTCWCFPLTCLMPQGCLHKRLKLCLKPHGEKTLCYECSKCVRCAKNLGCSQTGKAWKLERVNSLNVKSRSLNANYLLWTSNSLVLRTCKVAAAMELSTEEYEGQRSVGKLCNCHSSGLFGKWDHHHSMWHPGMHCG